MDQPFTRFYCDVCGEPINDIGRGYVIWKTDKADHYREHDFKIIHQKDCDLKDHASSTALSDMLGPDGLAKLLSFLSYGPLRDGSQQRPPKDMDEFVDLVRRLQSPHYEEARRRFGEDDVQADYADANEVYPYMQERLQAIIRRRP